MNRRGFFGSFGTLAVGAMVPAAIVPAEKPPFVPAVQRANGKAFIVGVATETVHAGDLVQIQTYGPVQVNTKK